MKEPADYLSYKKEKMQTLNNKATTTTTTKKEEKKKENLGKVPTSLFCFFIMPLVRGMYTEPTKIFLLLS